MVFVGTGDGQAGGGFRVAGEEVGGGKVGVVHHEGHEGHEVRDGSEAAEGVVAVGNQVISDR